MRKRLKPNRAAHLRSDVRHPRRLAGRSGFTLVELLMVIAIIGILIGLLIPAVNIAFKTIRKQAIAMEVTTLSDAVEKYKQKFNDYPPDGTSAAIVTRHLRKVFPQIASSELALLTVPSVSHDSRGVGVMDPAEALVFFLGGYSNDPVYPLSGPGGPFYITDTAGNQINSSAAGPSSIYQCNVDRNEPLFDFKQDKLTLDVVGGLTVSTDDALTSGRRDLLPVYTPYGKAPIVYFDSRTYSTPVSGATFYNYYGSASAPFGITRPYRSDEVRTTVPLTPATADKYYRYMNGKTYQIHSAGLDDVFGQPAFTSGGGPVFYAFPSGKSIDFGPLPGSLPTVGQVNAYQSPGGLSQQLDNATNFSDGVLEDSLE